MARTEKKTKIKGLPPRVFLNERDAATGSYPYVPHNGTVNQNLRWLPFSDQNTLNFTQSNMYYGLGVPTASNYIPRLTFITTSLTGTGSVHAGIVDTYFNNQRYNTITQSYVPFKDNDQFQADGKSSGGSFWASGTNVEGLSAPIWSKNKIEIDFTPLTASSLTGSRGQLTSSYMGYYDFAQRKWVPLRPQGILVSVGPGGAGAFDPGSEADGPSSTFNTLMWGFSASHNPYFSNVVPWRSLLNRGKPISTYGFPFSWIFDATGSLTLAMSNYIDKPFLVEKIVVMMSASFRLSTLPGTLDNAKIPDGGAYYEQGTISSSYVVNNFFILNQRKTIQQPNLKVRLYDPEYERIRELRLVSGSNFSRDLITWFEIASFNNDYGFVASASLYPEYFYRDATIINTGSTARTTASWSSYLIMSGAVKSPNSTPLATTTTFGTPNVAVGKAYLDRGTEERTNYGWIGSRTGLSAMVISGRDLFGATTEFAGDKVSDGGSYQIQVGNSQNDWGKTNPYYLLPSDNLVFGWQLPTHDDIIGALNSDEATPTGSYVEFPVAPAKVILYGSYVSEGIGNNNTNQVLTSNSIHEAIE